jgi:hypothetical protein
MNTVALRSSIGISTYQSNQFGFKVRPSVQNDQASSALSKNDEYSSGENKSVASGQGEYKKDSREVAQIAKLRQEMQR